MCVCVCVCVCVCECVRVCVFPQAVDTIRLVIHSVNNAWLLLKGTAYAEIEASSCVDPKSSHLVPFMPRVNQNIAGLFFSAGDRMREIQSKIKMF